MAMAEERGGPSGQPAAKAPVPEALDDAQCSRCTKLAGCVRNANHPGLCRQEVGARARAMAVLRAALPRGPDEPSGRGPGCKGIHGGSRTIGLRGEVLVYYQKNDVSAAHPFLARPLA
eukprot:7391129-Prymnesium_polylepis.3